MAGSARSAIDRVGKRIVYVMWVCVMVVIVRI